jgi:hypothetical protein
MDLETVVTRARFSTPSALGEKAAFRPGRDLPASYSTGNTGSFIYVFVFQDSPLKYTDPDGRDDTEPTFFTQSAWEHYIGAEFSDSACFATAILNEISIEYTKQTGFSMTFEQGLTAMQNAVNYGAIEMDRFNVLDDDAAYINDIEDAANRMWQTTGLNGRFSYNSNSTQHRIYAIDFNGNLNDAEHFVNAIGANQYRDTTNGRIGSINNITIQGSRGFDFNSNISPRYLKTLPLAVPTEPARQQGAYNSFSQFQRFMRANGLKF